MNQYYFETSFFGEGNTEEEAWANAIAQFSLDPGTSYAVFNAHDGCTHGLELNKLEENNDSLKLVEPNGIFWRCTICGKTLHHAEIGGTYLLENDPKVFDQEGKEITAAIYQV
jgi:hypothetical protein